MVMALKVKVGLCQGAPPGGGGGAGLCEMRVLGFPLLEIPFVTYIGKSRPNG